MEFQLLFFIPLLVILVFLFKLAKRWRRSKPEPPTNLLPGPWKLPVIGNLHQLIGSLPHHSLTKLAKKHGPLMQLQLGEVPAVIISSPDFAKEVMKTQDPMFAQRPEHLATAIMSYNSTSLVFAPYGSYWRQLRKICILELLSVKRVQAYRSIREEEVQKFVQHLSLSSQNGKPVNLSKKLFSLINDVVSRAAIGSKCNDQDELISVLIKAITLAGGLGVPDVFPSLKFLHLFSRMKPKLESLHRRIDRILDNIINQHREKRKITTISNIKLQEEDLVDVLLRVQESGDLEFPLTTNNVKAVVLDIFTAGSETSSTSLEWAMSELMKNPRVMQKAQAEVRKVLKEKRNIEEKDIQELQYLKLVIKETLRLHPVAPLLPRESRERCEINGYRIPIKTKIIINAWAIGRDSEYWSDAESFKPERFYDSSIDFKGTNFEYIPFGAGRRICPGISFGIANIELPLAQLLYNFDWKLPNGIRSEKLDMTETIGATVRRKNDLYLIATPYIPLSQEGSTE